MLTSKIFASGRSYIFPESYTETHKKEHHPEVLTRIRPGDIITVLVEQEKNGGLSARFYVNQALGTAYPLIL
jgi:hypothetical protein